MCGIAGYFCVVAHPDDHHWLTQTQQTLAHRGPDGQGLWQADGIGLVHRRLAILDLSPAGHQPMSSPDQQLWLVFNGEIYNYLELRETLRHNGWQFKSDTDTEVILAAYQKWGIECVKYFNGMWALALWDNQQQQLFCSRDRFGIKPLYLYQDNDRLLFGSEIKALLTHPTVAIAPNPTAIYQYLSYGDSDQGATSFFQHIQQLEPGQSIVVSRTPQGLHRNYHRHWYFPQQEQALSPTEAVHAFGELFRSSMNLHLRSDVPIGTCLSGGLDSSSIVCLAAQLTQQQLHSPYKHQTFSSCFDDARFDERPFIQQVLQQTKAHSQLVFPKPDALLQTLPRLLYHQEQPFDSLSIFAQWCVMQAAQQDNIKVILDGQGADELLAGYGYDGLLWASLLRSGKTRQLGQEISQTLRQSPRRFPARLATMLYPALANRRTRQGSFWLAPDFVTQSHTPNALQQVEQRYSSPLKQMLFGLFQTRLPQLLRYEDRNSMAFSIEARVPFLDYRLVELVFGLPDDYLIHNGWSKWLLRESMAGILPETIRQRRDKMGFVTPQEQWLGHELRPWLQSIIADDGFQSRPWWDGKAIRQAYQSAPAPVLGKLTSTLWRIINLELWLAALPSWQRSP